VGRLIEADTIEDRFIYHRVTY